MNKQTSKLFSICIPMYNSSDYIRYAIQDLKNQSVSDFECIIIDDASSDNSVEIVKALIEDDERFVLFSNDTNRGVSYCRNLGLESSRGEYILFLDSDDRYDDELLKENKMIIDKSKTPIDVISWEFGGVDDDGSRVPELELWRANEISTNPKPVGEYDPINYSGSIFQININSMCAKSFRREHLIRNKIKFDNHIKYAEDALFSYTAICLAKTIQAVDSNKILYYYRRNQPNSAMHTMKYVNQIKYHFMVVKSLSELLNNIGDTNESYTKSFRKWAADGVASIMYRADRDYANRLDSLNVDIKYIESQPLWRFVRGVQDHVHSMLR